MKNNRFVIGWMLFTISFNILTAIAQTSQPPAQQLPSPYKIAFDARQTLDPGKLLVAMTELRHQENAYLNSKLASSYIQNEAWYCSLTGDYQQAIAWMDSMQQPPKPKSRDDIAKQAAVLENFKPVDAIKAIETIADQHQVIMINEAHHVALHRQFMIDVLKVLRRKGFTHFAAETFDHLEMTGLSKRGFPLYTKTGFYSDEPVFGNLIRTAVQLGYIPIGYEELSPCEFDAADPERCIRERETGQAKNLKDRILVKNPKAKIVIYAGYAHIQKGGFSATAPSMAQKFQEFTGITPFTIDQIKMMEHSGPDFEVAVYRYAVEAGLVKTPTVFQNSEAQFFVSASSKANFDMQVFHPRTGYRQSRPDWLLRDKSKHLWTIPEDWLKSSLPVLIQAFHEKEGVQAVPVDQLLITTLRNQPALVLPTGTYLVRAIDATGKCTREQKITITRQMPK